MFYYFTREWWRYICGPVKSWQKDGLWWIRIPLCRWRGHPYGVPFYNPGGWEPDMHFNNCGDDLG